MNESEITSSQSWTFFDKIYCISIDERHDRREQAKKQFKDVGVGDRVEFVIVKKHPHNREKGIFQSHMFCLRKGLQENAKNILIFEDDVFFKGFDHRIMADVSQSLEQNTPWDAFFIGCITDGSRKTPKNNLVKITYRCLSHAYALNQHFAARIIQESWSGIPFDVLLRRYNTDFYALFPMCAFQGMASSDNQTMAIDRIRRCFGGLSFIQKANEMYQNHKVLLLLLPFVLLFGFSMLLYLW